VGGPPTTDWHVDPFLSHGLQVFKLEEMREKSLHRVVTGIQRAWRAFSARKWYLELRAATQDIMYGHKERRKNTLNRKYWGDYLQVRKMPAVVAMLQKQGDTSNIVFADNVNKLNRSWKKDRRVLLITNKVSDPRALAPCTALAGWRDLTALGSVALWAVRRAGDLHPGRQEALADPQGRPGPSHHHRAERSRRYALAPTPNLAL